MYELFSGALLHFKKVSCNQHVKQKNTREWKVILK